nr:hypothetical protein BaRGS_004460 [Batillaria attramentaria]
MGIDEDEDDAMEVHVVVFRVGTNRPVLNHVEKTVTADVTGILVFVTVSNRNSKQTAMEVSPENALRDTEGDKTETTDPDGNYSRLENYENPDDIRPYSMLQTDRGHNTNINIQGDKEAVLYHNT